RYDSDPGVLVVSVLIRAVFFFSSRRRHTRFSRDWSSDVCSSDLHAGRAVTLGGLIVQRQVLFDRNARIGQLQVDRLVFLMVGVRSEERRVGKEGRSRWSQRV